MSLGAILGIIGTLGGIATAGVNYANQQENLEYQKKLQQQVFEREDNSVARRAQDLQNVGLSKTLADGEGASSGAVISTKPSELNVLDKVATGLGYAQQVANIEKTNADTANAYIQGRVMEDNLLTAEYERAYIQAKTSLEAGMVDMLPLTRQQKESSIALTNQQLRQIDEAIKASELGRQIKTYEYHNILPNEALQSALQIGLLRKQGAKLDADIAYRNLEKDLLTYNITSAMFQSKISELDYNYQLSTGLKPGTGGSVGSLSGSLFDTLSRSSFGSWFKNSTDRLLSFLPWKPNWSDSPVTGNGGRGW